MGNILDSKPHGRTYKTRQPHIVPVKPWKHPRPWTPQLPFTVAPNYLLVKNILEPVKGYLGVSGQPKPYLTLNPMNPRSETKPFRVLSLWVRICCISQ